MKNKKIITCLFIIVLNLIYLVWRSAFTLNRTSLALSTLLLCLELSGFFSFICILILSLGVNKNEKRVFKDGKYDCAILIVAYQESFEIVKLTIDAALKVRRHHGIWVSDDGKSEKLNEYAKKVGIGYIRRDINSDAKAGNINNALKTIKNDFVLILDADHRPDPTILEKTLGYFVDTNVAIVQTTQSFYNKNSFEHNSKIPLRAGTPWCESAYLHETLMPWLNSYGGAGWTGTGAILRSSTIHQIGGIATHSISEDMATTLTLQTSGHTVIYHDEVLTSGLAAQNMKQFLVQRYRWAAGGIQNVKKFTFAKNLNFGQRLHIISNGQFNVFGPWRTLIFLVFPFFTFWLGIIPMHANVLVFSILFWSMFISNQQYLLSISNGTINIKADMPYTLIALQARLQATFVLFRNTPLPFHSSGLSINAEKTLMRDVPMLIWVLLLFNAITMIAMINQTSKLSLNFETVVWAGFSLYWLSVNMIALIQAVQLAARKAAQ